MLRSSLGHIAGAIRAGETRGQRTGMVRRNKVLACMPPRHAADANALRAGVPAVRTAVSEVGTLSRATRGTDGHARHSPPKKNTPQASQLAGRRNDASLRQWTNCLLAQEEWHQNLWLYCADKRTVRGFE